MTLFFYLLVDTKGMTFYDRVKNEVKLKNKSIEDWLEDNFKGEITRDTYNGWRRRGNLPRLDDAIRIARKLGTSVDYLYDGSDKELSFDDQTLLALARKHADLLADVDVLPPDKLEFIKMQVKSVADFTRQSKEKAAK
jgi:transcriptional regulator with XRE-family HTH domain